MIKKKQIDSSKIERDIITQMILNTDFLQKIEKTYKKNSLKMPYTNTIADLCIEYYKEYDQAPGQHIQDLYNNITRIDPDQKELIKTFLVSINLDLENYKPDKLYNTDFHLKNATDHLTHIKLSRLHETLGEMIKGKEYKKAEQVCNSFETIDAEYNKSVNALTDKEFLIESYESDKREVLLNLPGAIGEMIGPIRRGGYYLIQAGSGIGKSWFLSWIALHGAMSGIETALTPLEMTNLQTNLRVQHMLSGLCLYKEKDDKLFIPVWDCYFNQTGECERSVDPIATSRTVKSGFKEETKYTIPTYHDFDMYSDHICCTKCKETTPLSSAKYFKPSTWYKVEKANYATADKSIEYLDVLSESGLVNAGIYIDDFPREDLSTDDYEAYLHNLYHHQNILIDLGVIDYADEMKKDNRRDERLGLNQIHGDLKAIAQKRHIAIVSASQENDEGKLFGSRKKMHLMDSGIRILQTNEEKTRGIFRAMDIKQRFGKGTKGKVLYCLQRLEIGKPVLDTYWGDE